MVWAFLIICVGAAVALVVMRSRKEEDPAPIVAVPKAPSKPATPLLRTKSATTPPPAAAPDPATPQPAAPIAAAIITESEPIKRVTPPRLPSSIPLEDPLGELELGRAGARPKAASTPPETRSKYEAPEVVYDPKSTPEIPLAEDPRSKTPTAAPIGDARTKSATIPPVVHAKAPTLPPPEAPRAKAPSVAPPVAAAAPAMEEISIPVAPESGLAIRARRPSTAPPVAPEPTKKGTPAKGVVVRKPPTLPPDPNRKGTPAHGIALRSKTPGAVQRIAPIEPPPVVIPDGLANKLRYTTLTANISHVGIDAKREDGFTRVLMWPDVVGIVARRLPSDAPYNGATFIDLVSTAGATLRILPWTVLTGDAVAGEDVERARAFAQLVAARCRGAKLDSATRTFIGSHGQAAQLPDDDTLEAHDKRLA